MVPLSSCSYGRGRQEKFFKKKFGAVTNFQSHLVCFFLCALASDASGELNVLGHDRDTLGVNRAQVGVFEQTDQVGLGGFLKHKVLFHIKV